MQSQHLFEAPFVSEVGSSICSKDISAEKCMCRRCQEKMLLRSNPIYEPQWLFEAPAISSASEPLTFRQSWLFETLASPEADYMAGKRRKGKEHTKLTGGSKTRLRQKHTDGLKRTLDQNTAADQRALDTDRMVRKRKRSEALTLTGYEQPTEAQVVSIIQDKESEQNNIRTALSIARERRNHAEAQELEEKFWQLEIHIKKLKQFRLTL
jgi:hypothetical protein